MNPLPTSDDRFWLTAKGWTYAAMFVCYSRCLYCGRQTPHEVCHRHARPGSLLHRVDEAAVDASPDPDAEWSRRWERSQARAWHRWFDREPEVCPPECEGEPMLEAPR